MKHLLELLTILGAVILLALLLLDTTRPKFYKLNEKVKKAERTARKKGRANTERLTMAVKGAFIDQRIDGMEKEYLFKRVKLIEDLVTAKAQPSGPKYAAGDDMDKL